MAPHTSSRPLSAASEKQALEQQLASPRSAANWRPLSPMASPAPTWPTHPPPPSRFSRAAPGCSPLSSSLHPHAHSDVQSQYFAYPTPSLHSEYVLPPRRIRCMTHLRPWLPLIAYLATTLAFVVAFAFWRTELFQGLDDLSRWLKEDYYGYAALFFLIFATCFPPIPLYSTLIVLSGYTFGAEEGAVLSYCAALSGAVVVFLLSRYVCKDIISRWLASVRSIGRVCRAIEKRPTLLFLIRLAPYPYNVMNCLLAASPTLSFRTYVSCTALSLFKVYIHTYLGASIHSFAEYHAHASEHGKEDESPWARTIRSVVWRCASASSSTSLSSRVAQWTANSMAKTNCRHIRLRKPHPSLHIQRNAMMTLRRHI